MNHNQVKELLFKENPELNKEYNDLAPLYEIQNQVIELRKTRGLSQKQLAEMIGTKQSAISRLESGDYNPSVQLLHKIATAFDKEMHIEFR
jgi:DNA-binding XRE family transcriptional regulator